MEKHPKPSLDSAQPMASTGAARPPPLMDNAGWLSQLSFHWVQPIISLGAKGGITDDNLNDLSAQDESHNLFRVLKNQWEYEKWQNSPDPDTPSARCLGRAMVKTCMRPIVWAGFSGFIESVSKVGQAVLLGYLIRFFQDPDASLQAGLLFALGLSAMALVQGIMHHVYFFYAQRLGMQFRVALMGLMYHKSLGLPVSSSISTGAVINVISNDVEPFERVALFAHFLWLAPLESLMALYFLWAEVGVSAVIGLAAFYLLVPLQLWFAKLFSAIRTRTVEARDERVRLLSDTLTGISLIKLSAWEEAMRVKISQLRDSEAKYLKHANVLKALVEAIFFAMPPIAGVFTFISMHMIYHGFQSSQIFMTLALFNHLRLTFGQFVPKALESLAEAQVSLDRINNFLVHPEVGSGRQRLIVNQPSESTQSFDGIGPEQHPRALTAPTLNEKLNPKGAPDTTSMVSLCNASFSWTATSHSLASMDSVNSGTTETNTLGTRPVLREISLRIGAEELYAVVGPVGSGKTSLCMALLGELGLVGGTMHLGCPNTANKPGSSKMRTKSSLGPTIGYASQMAWIMAGTVRDNILFNAPYDPDWYEEVVSGCALERDFAILPQGDLTMVGEKGTNLSGGQRARICLARAIYQQADLYILDDPLSAVDPHVGRHIFDQAICGLLRNKPRLLVTHQLQFIRECDSVAVLHQGEIVANGSSQVVLANLPFSTMPGSPTHTNIPTVVDDSTATLDGFLAYLRDVSTHPEKSVPPVIRVSDADSDVESGPAHPPAYATNSNRTSICSSVYSYHSHGLNTLTHDTPYTLPSVLTGASTKPTLAKGDVSEAKAEAIGGEEEKATGTTPLSVYYEFFRYGTSPLGLLCLLLLLVLAQTSMVFTDVYLSQWASKPRAQQQAWHYPLVYGLLTLLTMILATVRAIAFFVVVLHGSTRVFQQMLDAVLHSRLHFFQANPQGRILNRFTKDQSSVDELLPMCIFDSFQCTMMVIGAIVIVSIANPWVIIAVPFILLGFGVLRHYYMLTNRVIKRIESTSRSPVYAILSETLDGVGVIRSFRATAHFQQRFVAALNQNSRAFFIFIATSRWLGFRLDMLSFAFLTVASFATVAARSTTDPGMVGLGLSYVLQLLGMVQWLIRQTTEVEIHFVAVERMLAYAHLPREPNQPTDPEVYPHWPSQGSIEFRGMHLQYPTAPAPVLRNITLTTQPHEKLGVVGRTGAGKSSLLTALFRLHEAYPADCITIDGVDISQLNLHFLRSRLSIIPQEAFLFHGTLRFNLDPFDKYTDAAIWAALDACKLKTLVTGLPAGLESEVTENGKNFSIGERQLLSLCRAVLRKAPVVVMDEATANVDLNTDQLIQQTIQTEFKHSTVLTIAHRLNTVIGSCHRILVLDQGQVQELGAPWGLLQKPDGWLAGMVTRTGPESARELYAAARQNWLSKHNEPQNVD